MRVLELFAGIGGMALGLGRAGMETAALVEIDPACRFWLARNFPGVPLFDDVRAVTASALAERGVGRIDLIAGGFPCQPHSVAGKRKGREDARHLWPEFARLVREIRPRWVLAENVPGIRTTAADEVLADLEAAGYACWPLVVGADDVGAPHRRKRVWFVGRLRLADSDLERERDADELRRIEWAGRAGAPDAGGSGEALADRDGPGLHRQRICWLRPDQWKGEAAFGRHDADGRGERHVGDASGEGLAQRQQPEVERGDVRDTRPPAAEDGAGSRWPARPGEPQHEWEAPRLVESGMGQSASGLPRRLARGRSAARRARLKALGNAVVPQVAEAIGRAIMRCDQC